MSKSSSMQQIDPGERMRISQLQKEKSEDKNRVEFLYSGDKIDRDAYLLGKPIDKVITEKEKSEANKAAAYSMSTVDLANKIREDPLFEIKKQEIESKKRLLENPHKFRQLKELISKASHNGGNGRSQRRGGDSSSSSSSSSERERKHKKKHKHKNRRSRSRSRSPMKVRKHESDEYGYKRRDVDRHHVTTSRHDDDERAAEKIEEINRYKKRIDDLKKIRSKAQDDESSTRQDSIKKKLTDKEREEKLKQMSANAQWRHEVRNQNVSKYRDEDKMDDLDIKSGHASAKDAINTLMRDAYSSTEDRIKRNYRNIQKSDDAYQSNFARK